MKVYKFNISHFCYSERIYVLAESKKQAIEIVMAKTKHDYDSASNCLEKIYERPQVILNVEDTD